MKHTANQCIIFVSSTKLCTRLYKIFSHLYSCTYVYASLDMRSQNIQAFKDKKFKFIFATSVLERGITIKDIDVVILNFGKIFDYSNLIQMLGRVGRNINNPYGKAYILSDHFDSNITSSINYLKLANSYL